MTRGWRLLVAGFGIFTCAPPLLARGFESPSPSADAFSVQSTEKPLQFEVLTHTNTSSDNPLRVIGVTQGDRGTVSINPDGTLTYTPDPTKPFRVRELDLAPDGSPANENSGGGTYSYAPQIVIRGAPVVNSQGIVTFSSAATNLLQNGNGLVNGYIAHVAGGPLEHVTRTSTGASLNGDAAVEFASLDGNFVSFETPATNVLPPPYWNPGPVLPPSSVPNCGDFCDLFNIYLLNRSTGQVSPVSVSPDGMAEGDGNSQLGILATGGKHIVFISNSTNLLSPYEKLPAGTYQVYERDLVTGRTSIVSVDEQGNPGNATSSDISVSGDGRYVIFGSYATGSYPFPATLPAPRPAAQDACGESNIQVYVHDRGAPGGVPSTFMVSTDADGNPGNAESCGTQISANGRYAEFLSYATNLVPGATGDHLQFYARDLRGDRGIWRLINAYDGGELNSDVSAFPSPKFRWLGFWTTATNVFPKPTPENAPLRCYVYDTERELPVLVSVNASGIPADGPCTSVSVSEDGQYAALAAQAPNMTGVEDAFYHVYVVSKTDVFTYTVADQQGRTATGTIYITEPLTGPESGRAIQKKSKPLG